MPPPGWGGPEVLSDDSCLGIEYMVDEEFLDDQYRLLRSTKAAFSSGVRVLLLPPISCFSRSRTGIRVTADGFDHCRHRKPTEVTGIGPTGTPALLVSLRLDSFTSVTCIAIPDRHRRLLTALTRGPRPVDDLDSREGLDELRRWGWVFGGEWVELTGAGHYHAGAVVGGLVER